MYTFIYITVIIRKLQRAIVFTISGLTPPLTDEDVLCVCFSKVDKRRPNLMQCFWLLVKVCQQMQHQFNLSVHTSVLDLKLYSDDIVMMI